MTDRPLVHPSWCYRCGLDARSSLFVSWHQDSRGDMTGGYVCGAVALPLPPWNALYDLLHEIPGGMDLVTCFGLGVMKRGRW